MYKLQMDGVMRLLHLCMGRLPRHLTLLPYSILVHTPFYSSSPSLHHHLAGLDFPCHDGRLLVPLELFSPIKEGAFGRLTAL